MWRNGNPDMHWWCVLNVQYCMGCVLQLLIRVLSVLFTKISCIYCRPCGELVKYRQQCLSQLSLGQSPSLLSLLFSVLSTIWNVVLTFQLQTAFSWIYSENCLIQHLWNPCHWAFQPLFSSSISYVHCFYTIYSDILLYSDKTVASQCMSD